MLLVLAFNIRGGKYADDNVVTEYVSCVFASRSFRIRACASSEGSACCKAASVQSAIGFLDAATIGVDARPFRRRKGAECDARGDKGGRCSAG